MFYSQQGSSGTRFLLNHYGLEHVFSIIIIIWELTQIFHHSLQMQFRQFHLDQELYLCKDVPRSNPQNINNNPEWLNTYDRPYSERLDLDSRNLTFR